MPINKIDPVWAENESSGQIETPPDALIQEGWTADDQPPAEYENFKNKRTDEKLNNLVDHEWLTAENDYCGQFYDPASLCSGLMPDVSDYRTNGGYETPTSTTNRIRKTTGIWASMCAGYDYKNNRECIFLLGTDPTKLTVVTSRGPVDTKMPFFYRNIIQTEITLTGGPSDDDTGIDICCDGDHIYIAANDEDDGASTIYKFELNEINTVEPACIAHRQFGSENIFRDPLGGGANCGHQLCIADDSNLAFLNRSGDDSIGIVTKELNADATYGVGKMGYVDGISGFASYSFADHIISDGTRIWVPSLVEISGTYQYFIIPVLISDPTDDTGGITRESPLYFPTADSIRFGALAFDYNAIHVFTYAYKDTGTPGEILTHSVYDSIFDLESEYWVTGRYRIADGMGITDDTFPRMRATFTGRRVALVVPVCPIQDLTTTNLFSNCNKDQRGLVLLDKNRGGHNAPMAVSLDQVIEIGGSRITALEPLERDSLFSNAQQVAYADDCVWILAHHKITESPATYHSVLTRVTAISRRI